MEGTFATFFESLKDPLLMFMAMAIAALVKWGLTERKERVQKDKEKDEQYKELINFGNDVVKLTTIWEEKAKQELSKTDNREVELNEKYSKILEVLVDIKHTMESLKK